MSVIPFRPVRGALAATLCDRRTAPGKSDSVSYLGTRLPDPDDCIMVPKHVLAALDVLVAIGLMVLRDMEHDDAIRDALDELAGDNPPTVH